MNKYVAEFFGTFVLSLIIGLSLPPSSFSALTPILAALILGTFVYTIGHISGSHINPAVSTGLITVGKLKVRDLLNYVSAQLLGAMVAGFVTGNIFSLALTFTTRAFVTETIGTIIFVFGIAAVVYGRVKEHSGVVIGTSLLLGIFLSMLLGGVGVLNPAVAISIGMLDLGYILGPILGAIIAFKLYKIIAKEK